jgi:RNA polymerase sigma-70 factor (ECF subfamily)
MKISASTRVNPIGHMNTAHLTWLVSECIAGNEDAIETLVRQYEGSVFRLALSIVGETAEANEITQDTFIAALRALPAYEEQKSFKAWLFTITVNQSRSRLRKRKTLERLKASLTTLFHVEFQKQALPEEMVIQNEKEAALWRALQQMDEPHRMVVVLRYFHELSVMEIAEVLSISEGTVHSRLHNARAKLKSALKHVNGEYS